MLLDPSLRCRRWVVASAAVLAWPACGAGIESTGTGGTGGALDAGLVVNEVVVKNQGTAVDEVGESDDWLELLNAGTEPLQLADFELKDDSHDLYRLPEHVLESGEYLVLWADDTPSQGSFHLPFKLSSSGETLTLAQVASHRSAQFVVPSLEENESYGRFPDGGAVLERCRYATPGRSNGEQCEPPPPRAMPTDVDFSDFELGDDYPEPTGPLAIAEASLRPADFVELVNVSTEDQPLASFRLQLAAISPGTEFPGPDDGIAVPLPADSVLEPGERLSVPIEVDRVTSEIDEKDFEGVLALFDEEGEVLDRWDFVRWPEGAVLARFPDDSSHAIFCRHSTPAEPNVECDPLPSRDVGDRVRHLRTPGDFAALAEGSANLGMAPVKFVYDMQQGGALHLLSSRAWALHYTFVREVLDREPHLDRCDPDENSEFHAGWYAFSVSEYFQVEGRRYLLGTLVHHSGPDLHTVEYTLGDEISAADMRRGFMAAMGHVLQPSRWSLRPQDDSQTQTALEVDGTLPIVGQHAPFDGVTYQPLTPGVGYGTLRYVRAAELAEAALGPEVIVVTDDVPNDIPLVGALITEAFQTPLAHVNVLSQNRGTPNMALVGASDDERVAPFLDALVRLEVSADGFALSRADPAEAEAYWDSLLPEGPAQTPRLDLAQRDLVDLSAAGLDSLPAIGAKAAQLAELGRVRAALPSVCDAASPWGLPRSAFAIPVVHFVEHFEASGAAALLARHRDDIAFRTDPEVRRVGLEAVRSAILQHPVEATLLRQIEDAIEDRFGNSRVRMRSSSNAEDLPGFNGAGLYTSTSVELDDPERSVEAGLRLVWSSLYNLRAYDERELARIDPESVAMGVLVHDAFLSERANGVAVSRNVLDPTRADIYYMNAQVGEASVTNPAPGASTEQFIYRWPPRFPTITYQTTSSLTQGRPVLSESEVVSIACALYGVHDHFAALLDPAASDPWFTMETEFKLLGDGHQLLLKQARPYSFGRDEPIGDCREF